MNENLQLPSSLENSPLNGKDLAPIPHEKRTWTMWNMTALWVGMAVCIPTYLLASNMIQSGLSWVAALVIIALANLVITLPMVLSGHAGVKYGIPFPVFGRASFGIYGVHIASLVRGIVACGWFGIQTWVGGLAFYSIYNIVTGQPGSADLDAGKFIGFGIFWLINIYFIWKGNESIKWLENYSAPILLLIGVALIFWGYQQVGSFSEVLEQGKQLQMRTAVIEQVEGDSANYQMTLSVIADSSGNPKAKEVNIWIPTDQGPVESGWRPVQTQVSIIPIPYSPDYHNGKSPVKVQFRDADKVMSSVISVLPEHHTNKTKPGILTYLIWFTAMVGFWATMAISISDITRWSKNQKDQTRGQFLGLPTTMTFYSFVAIFVTSAAIIAFKDVLIVEDTPWDPVSLLAKFKDPIVVVIAQIALIIATLSTNIAANVIAPANAIANVLPQKISFRAGGMIAAVVGILACPWWLMNDIGAILVFVSGLLGPVLGIILCDYFIIRKKTLALTDLYMTNGIYAYGGSGFNSAAIIALVAGVLVALVGFWIPMLDFLYTLSWFTGFGVAFLIYYILMKGKIEVTAPDNTETI
ncbi:MAG: NCS1 family nucleobase:cation symporter-1 [Saprospiraceae bacterium]|nr:NCS1 family nucleobase:cation symporter-1 [Saprospiraceae bacterium]